jgi:hypothetical protein
VLGRHDRRGVGRTRKFTVKVVCGIAGTDGGTCDLAGTDVTFERTRARGAAFLLYGAGTNAALSRLYEIQQKRHRLCMANTELRKPRYKRQAKSCYHPEAIFRRNLGDV